MYEIVRQVLLVPFLFLLAFINFRDHPVRTFTGSGQPIVAPAGRWEKASPLPTERYDFGSAVFDNKLYIVGGLVLPSPWVPTNRVDVYDPSTDSWTRLADYPKVVHHEGVVACNNELYVIAGYWLRIWPSFSVYRYRAAENAWERRADIPIARGAAGAVCVSNKIYVVGGENEQGQLQSLVVYDTTKDTWEHKSPMPTAREHVAVVAAEDKIFAIGGLQGDRFHSLTVNEVYDAATDTWETRAPLPHAVNGLFGVVLGESIYVFGGARGDALSPEVFEYNLAKDTWVRRADMPVGRYGYAIGVMNNRIHVVGGNTVVRGNFFSQDHDVFIP
jgi:N-acetylneuraminic acid mutarotase